MIRVDAAGICAEAANFPTSHHIICLHLKYVGGVFTSVAYIVSVQGEGRYEETFKIFVLHIASCFVLLRNFLIFPCKNEYRVTVHIGYSCHCLHPPIEYGSVS